MDRLGGYLCHICADGAIYESTHGIRMHHYGEHKAVGLIYQCRHCGDTSDDLHQAEEHERGHLRGKLYRCLHCLRTFTTKQYCQVHIGNRHEKAVLGEPCACSQCGVRFISADHVQTHVFFKHSDLVRLPEPDGSESQRASSDKKSGQSQSNTDFQTTAKQNPNPSQHECEGSGRILLTRNLTAATSNPRADHSGWSLDTANANSQLCAGQMTSGSGVTARTDGHAKEKIMVMAGDDTDSEVVVDDSPDETEVPLDLSTHSGRS